MRSLVVLSTASVFILAGIAFAKAPGDIADLVGARAPGAESEMQARGYVDVKNNTWWNASSKICVRVHVSQGKYASITQVKASACGHASGGGGGVVCPPDLSQADLYEHPGCSL